MTPRCGMWVEVWVDVGEKCGEKWESHPPSYERLDCIAARATHQIRLVEQNQIGEFELVDQQMGDSAIIVICRLPATVDELVDGSELLKDGRGVDDGHQVAQARHVAQLHPCVFIGIRKGLGHWQRLHSAREDGGAFERLHLLHPP